MMLDENRIVNFTREMWDLRTTSLQIGNLASQGQYPAHSRDLPEEYMSHTCLSALPPISPSSSRDPRFTPLISSIPTKHPWFLFLGWNPRLGIVFNSHQYSESCITQIDRIWLKYAIYPLDYFYNEIQISSSNSNF